MLSLIGFLYFKKEYIPSPLLLNPISQGSKFEIEMQFASSIFSFRKFTFFSSHFNDLKIESAFLVPISIFHLDNMDFEL